MYDVMIQKLWAPGGACARMVEDRDSAFWAGLARAQARRAEATEARWAEQRAAHAASGRSGTFVEYKTEFASVWYCNGGFRVHVGVGGGYLNVTYRDLHVAALAADIARIECDRAPLNFPKRAVCLAVPPPPDVLEEMMQTAAGGGSCVRVVLKDSAELVRVRYVVEQTLALEMATDRRAFGRRLVEEARKRGGVVGNDDLYDELAARVDAAGTTSGCWATGSAPRASPRLPKTAASRTGRNAAAPRPTTLKRGPCPTISPPSAPPTPRSRACRPTNEAAPEPTSERTSARELESFSSRRARRRPD